MKKLLTMAALFAVFLVGCGTEEDIVESEEELSPIESAVVNVEREDLEDFDGDTYPNGEYEALRRSPEEYYNEKVYFVAEVFQVINEGETYKEYLMDLRDTESLTLAYVIVETDRTTERYLEDDFIGLFGKAMGEMSYETSGGSTSTVPIIYADFSVLR